MSFYEAYKPFRNYLRQFDLPSSLVDVWQYFLHIAEGRPLPANYAIGKNAATIGPMKDHIYPWDLDILARELILNAGIGGKRSLRKWDDLATAINHLRRLDDAAFESRPQQDILFEVHRIAHRQFPWQMNKGVNPMMRAFKVFGGQGVAAIVHRELGMTVDEFFLLGMAVSGHFLKNPGLIVYKDYSALGISKDAGDGFFRRLSCPLEELRKTTSKYQAYNQDWLYAWNPLVATPLIRINPLHLDRLICPLPPYLMRRATTGIFYDLVRSSDFDNPFGHSFEAYIGEVIQITCPPPKFSLFAEEPYFLGTNKKQGVDWILSDDTGHLFIEAKTKRLTVNAKTLSDVTALENDLLVMATAIAQHYRNIRDALDSKTRWQPDRRPIYPLVLTLEDWFIFSPRVREMLQVHVRRLLAQHGVAEEIMSEMPYTIMSAEEFELVAQIISRTAVVSVMGKKTGGEFGSWSMLPFINQEFKEEMKRVNWRLFDEEFNQLMPEAIDISALTK